ncbi:putative autophagy protein [Tritrichomonas foetus]|uniref:Autophagy protein n=1 Tax=Tritrichomonas foetus TaxID=1144522 RepID=A0A1J4L096_9EUKA|nr:putative autophagy protein [Tritrichomonas foetus]|eukprot:OHT16834.1 putative autophagy protein [Tritrichomonas foetus]
MRFLKRLVSRMRLKTTIFYLKILTIKIHSNIDDKTRKFMTSRFPINVVKFTPRAQSLCISLSNGFAIFTLDPLKKKIHRTFDDQSFGSAISLFDSSITVCSVNIGSPSVIEKMLCVYNESLGRVVFEVQSPEPIKDIFMLNKMFAFATKSEFRLYSFDPPMLYSQYKTNTNEQTPCDLIELGESFVLALIGRTPGTVRIIRNDKVDKPDLSISAHSHPITLLKLNYDGTLVATASSLGTVVKLYNTKTGSLIGQFRRGTLAAEIQSISFSPGSELLAVSSSKGTIHVFSISALYSGANEIRSDMKATCTSLGSPVLCFASNRLLYAASASGLIATFTVSEATKTISCTNTESFVDLLTLK